MPTVPRYGPQQVQAEALPGVRLSTDNPIEAFGGGRAVTDLSGIGEAAKGISNYIENEKKKADQVAFMGADGELADLETGIQIEAQNQLGHDALKAPDIAGEKWKKGIDDIRKRLYTDEQRFAFDKSVMHRWGSLNKNLQVHVSAQVRDLDQKETVSYIETARQAATLNFHDDERIADEIGRQRQGLAAWADRNGVPVDSNFYKLKELEAVSKTHFGVINARSDKGYDIAAKEYFERVKGEMTEEDRDRVHSTMKEASTRGEAQRQVDVLMTKYKSWGERTKETKKISDPLIRDAVEQRLSAEMQREHQLETRQREDIFLMATNAVEKNPGKPASEVVPASQWARLSLQEREALNAYHGVKTNDDNAWLEFFGLSSGEMAALSMADFKTRYWSKLDSSHRTRAENAWNTARTDTTKQVTVSDPFPYKEQLENSIREAKFIDEKTKLTDLDESQAGMVRKLEGAASKALEEFEMSTLGGKRKASPAERQKVIDEVVLKRRVKLNEWGSDPERPVTVLSEDEKKKAYVPYTQVPASERTKIESYFKAKGKRVTKDKVERLYGAMIIGDKALVEAIKGE